MLILSAMNIWIFCTHDANMPRLCLCEHCLVRAARALISIEMTEIFLSNVYWNASHTNGSIVIYAKWFAFSNWTKSLHITSNIVENVLGKIQILIWLSVIELQSRNNRMSCLLIANYHCRWCFVILSFVASSCSFKCSNCFMIKCISLFGYFIHCEGVECYFEIQCNVWRKCSLTYCSRYANNPSNFLKKWGKNKKAAQLQVFRTASHFLCPKRLNSNRKCARKIWFSHFNYTRGNIFS